MASFPTESTSCLFPARTVTTVGSRSTIPCPRMATRVFTVPRSTAIPPPSVPINRLENIYGIPPQSYLSLGSMSNLAMVIPAKKAILKNPLIFRETLPFFDVIRPKAWPLGESRLKSFWNSQIRLSMDFLMPPSLLPRFWIRKMATPFPFDERRRPGNAGAGRDHPLCRQASRRSTTMP